MNIDTGQNLVDESGMERLQGEKCSLCNIDGTSLSDLSVFANTHKLHLIVEVKLLCTFTP